MLPYNLFDAVRGTMRQRTDWMEAGQSLQLAVRITPTTPGATRCPSCWDDTRKQTTVPNDPVCLGVGWIIPASGFVPQQGGYLLPTSLPDAFINANQDQTQWTPQGLIATSQDVLYMEPAASVHAKKGDVLIQTGAPLAHSRRYVISDETNPETLGAAILYLRYTLEYREPANIIYLVPPADLTGRAPGQWGT